MIRALLNGDEVEFTWRGQTSVIQMAMPELDFIDLNHPIPIYVSGFGPKAQALAGEYGDGLVMSIPPQPDFMERSLRNVQYGADQAGRSLDVDTFHTTSLTTAVILEPGESLTSERVIRECGAFVISSLHYIYDKVRQWGGQSAITCTGHLGGVQSTRRANA